MSSMRPINQKCLECALNYRRGLRETNIDYRPEPSCWAGQACEKKRSYYRKLKEYQTKAREYHRYLRNKGDCCRLCKSLKLLEVHHIKQQIDGGSDEPSNLMTLCHKCHIVITSYQRVLSIS